jgi:hypothetical protein
MVWRISILGYPPQPNFAKTDTTSTYSISSVRRFLPASIPAPATLQSSRGRIAVTHKNNCCRSLVLSPPSNRSSIRGYQMLESMTPASQLLVGTVWRLERIRRETFGCSIVNRCESRSVVSHCHRTGGAREVRVRIPAAAPKNRDLSSKVYASLYVRLPGRTALPIQ